MKFVKHPQFEYHRVEPPKTLTFRGKVVSGTFFKDGKCYLDVRIVEGKDDVLLFEEECRIAATVPFVSSVGMEIIRFKLPFRYNRIEAFMTDASGHRITSFDLKPEVSVTIVAVCDKLWGNKDLSSVTWVVTALRLES